MTKRKKTMYITLVFLTIIGLGAFVYLSHPLFGKNPSGKHLERIKKSPNYKDGAFQNVEETLLMSEGVTIWDAFKEVLFSIHKDASPKDSIPSVDINFETLKPDENVLIWLGHSSYYLQLDGVKIIVDPILTNNASPLYGSTRAFKGTDKIRPKDLPHIDYLILTHDHYDHMDYTTIKEIKNKVTHIITPLGVGAHLEHWGIDAKKITELDWDDSFTLKNDLQLTATTARHGSGRQFKRNQTLWTSYVLQTSNQTLFLGGDSGYGNHFKAIGEKYGPFDLAILENGQYNKKWKYIHMFPEQVLQAAIDLKAKRLLPVHSGKFRLSTHAWYEPLRELNRINNEKYQQAILTPIIGETVDLNDSTKVYKLWFN